MRHLLKKLAQKRSSARRYLTAVVGLFVCICLFITLAPPASAEAGGKRELEAHESDLAIRATRILENVRLKAGATNEELDATVLFVLDYCASSLEDGAMESALSRAHEMGCEQECLGEVAKSMRDAVEKGLPADQAEQLVIRAALETKKWCEQLGIPLDNRGFATRLKVRFSGYLARQ
jgi:hypothetical protein